MGTLMRIFLVNWVDMSISGGITRANPGKMSTSLYASPSSIVFTNISCMSKVINDLLLQIKILCKYDDVKVT